MKTYFIADEKVRRYLSDLVERLATWESRPVVWCPITKSGLSLLKALTDEIRDAKLPGFNDVAIVPIEMKSGTPFFPTQESHLISGKSVLLLDGAIHSGRTMSACVDEVTKHQPAEISSYALVVKQDSEFIPTCWGVSIDSTDRAFFLLDKIPNNRLEAGKKGQTPLHIRRLRKSHTTQPPTVSGVSSMDRMTWGDRLYQMNAEGNGSPCTSVLERAGGIVGFLTTHKLENGGLAVDEVAVDKAHQSKGYGGVLIRYADTLARQSDCRYVRLNAIKDRVKMYEKFGYRPIPGREPAYLDDEEYVPMDRQVLYHTPPTA